MHPKMSPSLTQLVEAWFAQAKAARIETTTKALLGKTKAQTKTKQKLGAVFTRSWRGRLYRAEIMSSGVVCNGINYSSLSSAAKAITGQTISGPRFFKVRG